MRLTKLGHACVRLEKDDATLVIDPGVWSGDGALRGASAVLITHEHPDHLVPDALRAALAGDPALELWAHESVAGQFTGFRGRVHSVGHGDAFTAAGFDVHVHGREHAQIHRDIPVIPNIGFLLDGEVFHPGDAFTVPDEPVPTLLLPISAPWLSTGETIDYAREVSPVRAYAIHDELLNANGLGLIEQLMTLVAEPTGSAYTRLEPGSTVDL